MEEEQQFKALTAIWEKKSSELVGEFSPVIYILRPDLKNSKEELGSGSALF